MKVYSERFGPLKYFKFIATVVVLLPYVGKFPDHWLLCGFISGSALYSFLYYVKSIESKLVKMKESKLTKETATLGASFTALMFGNALLVQAL